MTEPENVVLQKAVDILRREAAYYYKVYQTAPNAPFAAYEKYKELERIAREITIIVEGL